MSLLSSISGIRGTLGGRPGEGLTPVDIVQFTSGYGQWIINTKRNRKVVVGRDSRPSGKYIQDLVIHTLILQGISIVDIGLSTTPTVEIAVTKEKAGGGIVITASHNPIEWNALKLLNERGEFISSEDGEQIIKLSSTGDFVFADYKKMGIAIQKTDYIDKHINLILRLKEVDLSAIKKSDFKIVIDGINSTGAIAVPALLKKLGVKKFVCINSQTTGIFSHKPEPLEENLTSISLAVKKHKADLGIVVDPDVDRLVFVCENGKLFGEEYTLVAVADYILKLNKGNTVSNLSSTRGLRDVTEKSGGRYFASAVGEVNVVECMKKNKAVIGGEGNGGVIFPKLHYGRDALVGIALFLSHLAISKMKMTEMKATYPSYFMSKNKIELNPTINTNEILAQLKLKYKKQILNTVDGLKIDFENEWVHLRKSNTEPIIRIYTESKNKVSANELAGRFVNEIKELISK